MGKINEIIEKNQLPSNHYADQDFNAYGIFSVASAMKEYAEYYARECLKIAAEKAKVRVREFHEEEYSKDELYNYLNILDNSCGLTDEDGCLYQVNAYDVDSLSILNIKLPEHD